MRVADRLVGIRTNDHQVHAELREVLAPVVTDEIDAPPHLSIVVGDEQDGHRTKDLLYCGCELALATVDTSRLLRAVVRHLAGHREPDSADRLRIQGGLLARNAEAVILLTAELSRYSEPLERRLRHDGWRVVDVPFVDVDATRGEIVLEPWAPIEERALARWGDDTGIWDERRGSQEVAARLPLRAVLVPIAASRSGTASAVATLAHATVRRVGEPTASLRGDIELARTMMRATEMRPCEADVQALMEVIAMRTG